MNREPQVMNIQERRALLVVALCLVGIIFMARLFYLQVIRHDHYRTLARASQFKKFELPAERGVIELTDGDKTVPVVLNEKLYTLYADPFYVKDPTETAKRLAGSMSLPELEVRKKLENKDSRYQILARKVSKNDAKKIDDLNLVGIGLKEETYRTYPQGGLAAQLLGFVNADGVGQYGIEGFYNDALKGVTGQLKAVTDARGVPLAANTDNIVKQPVAGKRTVLTIDIGIQKAAEEVLKKGLESAEAAKGSIIVIDPNTGAVKAMANYPSYNPAEYEKVEDISVFNNYVVTDELEPGSIIKSLTVAAAIDQKVITKDTTYADPDAITVDGFTIRNSQTYGAGTRSIKDVLQKSLNTGVVTILKKMGGQDEINQKGRDALHNYFVGHYQLGKTTGIEQSGESSGSVPDSKDRSVSDVQYANMTFGQGMAASLIQVASAFSSLINGGKYYQPHVVAKTIDTDNNETLVQPKVVKDDVISASTSNDMVQLLEYVLSTNNRAQGTRAGFIMGGKSGTAQTAKPEGGYYEDRYNGTYTGFVGGDKPQYAIVVLAREPKRAGFAGAIAAAPMFIDMTQHLLNNGYVSPKSQ